ncbi:AAA-associated domain-containing protein [Streptomyces carpaticus]|uniref:AAA-associated domain-containing protein n=1 Tax=Streptomyces carpaticus TaxID=285558 RepID=UPI003D1540E0
MNHTTYASTVVTSTTTGWRPSGSSRGNALPLVDAAMLLGLAGTARARISLTPAGREFTAASLLRGKELFSCDALARAPLVQTGAGDRPGPANRAGPHAARGVLPRPPAPRLHPRQGPRPTGHRRRLEPPPPGSRGDGPPDTGHTTRAGSSFGRAPAAAPSP